MNRTAFWRAGSLLTSLWTFWGAITGAFLLTGRGAGEPGAWNHDLNNWLGFFTPMGYGNLIGSSEHYKWIITLPLLYIRRDFPGQRRRQEDPVSRIETLLEPLGSDPDHHGY